jgi:hypothetical protein
MHSIVHDAAYIHQRVKSYTREHIQHLQSTTVGHMFGVGPIQNYPKLEKRPDPMGGRKRTEAYRSKPVINGVLNINIDGISFVYENYSETLTVREKYAYVPVLRVKHKGGIPCSEIYDSHGGLELGKMFLIHGIIHVMVQHSLLGMVSVRNHITDEISPHHIVISIPNARFNIQFIQSNTLIIFEI